MNLKKKFRPGDKVKLHNSKNIMTVMKYIKKQYSIFGSLRSNIYVLCHWYDSKNSKINQGVFHQRMLEEA